MITARSLADILHEHTRQDEEKVPTTEPERLVHLVGLLALLEAVLAAGWTEHTNDWDWFLYVTLTDGTEIEADGWGLVNSNQPDKLLELGFVNDVPRHRPMGEHDADAMHLEWTKDTTFTRIVPLDQIVKIHVEEA